MIVSSLLESAQTRTLANVLLEIEHARKQSAVATFKFYGVDGRKDQESADHYSDLGAKWDDRRLELEEEAKGMIQVATGVSWDQLSEALL
jgi:hypothetical protein